MAGVVLMLGAGSAKATTITFDDVPGPAPVAFGDVVPGGAFGPILDFGSVVIDGGVIGLAITPSDQAATTLPNFYATTDFQTLADGSSLPGVISGVLASPVNSISLDVGNGNVFGASFTLTAFDGASVVDTATVSLDAFGSASGFVGELSVSAPAISSFTVTSNQPAGTVLFTVDTIVLAVPEPGIAVLALTTLIFVVRKGRSRR